MKTRAASIGLAVAALTGAPAVAANAATSSEQPGRIPAAHTTATAPGQSSRPGARTTTPACGCEHHRSPGHHKAHHPRKPKHHKGSGHHGHKPCPPPKPKPCPPPKHHHPKPPVVVVHPKPPIIEPAPKPVVHVVSTTPAARVRLTADTLPTTLPRTGGASVQLAVIGGGLAGAGGLLLSLVWLTEPARRFNRQVKR